jgi:2'-5' RNA ligase
MTLLRVFIAIEIPLPIRQAIFEQTGAMRRAVGPLIRWVPIENLHLTLKFIGEVSPANVELIQQMLGIEAAAVAPFQVQVGGLGAFPSPRRARVIWIGIQAPPTLASLQHGIQSGAARLGYNAEERPFSPHLTIGRVRQQVNTGEQQQIRSALEGTHVEDPGTARIRAVHLFKSDLQPGGSIYTKLFSAPLEGDTRAELDVPSMKTTR